MSKIPQMEPRLRAELTGSPIDGRIVWLDQAYLELEIKEPMDDGAGMEVLKYRLAGRGGALRYEFVSARPWAGEK